MGKRSRIDLLKNMFQNYSVTYASTITTFVGIIGVYLNRFGYTNNDIELVISSLVCVGGLAWQIIHRYNKGDVTVGGKRK